MNNNVFHSATIRGQLFEASMIYEGPWISLITPRSAVHDGVHLGVCNIVELDPTRDRCEEFGWYIVKYRSEARVFLRGFTIDDARALSEEFGIKLLDHGGWDSRTLFYRSKAWEGLKAWVRSHPRIAKRYAAGTNPYLSDWYLRANSEEMVPLPLG
ncbi:hypothetical protein AYO08_09885 [Pseudomonas putida]|uniref:hypothetical protein n=1 Tax=Pseudomonas TaxID=286 RepID=UPI0007DBF359|nr:MULTISPECIES: hypothetical protein [Pseudomonas]OAS07642.1 hypothetical protein AYO08_09885 [Pseudomonas putida]OOV90071.1 hypothetical protein MF6396_27530 [Pseudomonas sp. MF6396]QNV69525.1 hypothetical protein F7661_28965 [Pseudomonas sp. CFA]